MMTPITFSLTKEIAELSARVAMRVAEENGAKIAVTFCGAKLQGQFSFDASGGTRHPLISNERAALSCVTGQATKTLSECDDSHIYTLAYKLALAILKMIMPYNRNPAIFTDLVSVKTIEVAFMSCQLPDISQMPGPDTIIADPFPEGPFRQSVETVTRLVREMGAGGVPLIFKDTIIGSIGCSGGGEELDHECAVRGAQAAALLLSSEDVGAASFANSDSIVDDIFANVLSVSQQVERDAVWTNLLKYEKANWKYGQ